MLIKLNFESMMIVDQRHYLQDLFWFLHFYSFSFDGKLNYQKIHSYNKLPKVHYLG